MWVGLIIGFIIGVGFGGTMVTLLAAQDPTDPEEQMRLLREQNEERRKKKGK